MQAEAPVAPQSAVEDDSPALAERDFIPRGVRRLPTAKFIVRMLPWAGLLAVGLTAIYLCLAEGLFHTNMDNRFAFGLWIYLDLTVIALGAGAFFTGFLLYILKREEMGAVINSAVVLGLICYSGAVAVLMVDVGQPLRAWFTFWHPNTHSMLTEVTFCLTCYLCVLAVEYAPIVLKNRRLRQFPRLLTFEFEAHRVMPVLAAVGTLLSFFHQGSLGGLYGVLRGRPFAFRGEIGIFPSTFFLFVISAMAAGPSFIILTTRLAEAASGKRLVRPGVLSYLGKVSGLLLVFYVLLKSADTLVWMNSTAPSAGFSVFDFYDLSQFGTWILFIEIAVFGMVPGLILLRKKYRERPAVLTAAAAMVCAGVALNRYIMTIQTMALPTLPFDRFLSYTPSWEEVATFLAVVSYGVLLYAVTFRYTVLFPQERDLNS
jgi:Ni/Fe-hydrogenase subunit HybB-like protein